MDGIYPSWDKSEGFSVVEKLPNFFGDFWGRKRAKITIFTPTTFT